jgi:excisionase family DNA binding protein
MNRPSTYGLLPFAFEPDTPYGRGAPTLFENGIGRLVTVRDLARFLSCSEKTIRDWVLKGLVPTVRPMPRMVRFDLREIDRWLSERKV